MVLAPVLAGCPKPIDGPITLPPGGLVLPDCTEGQLLGTSASGALTCLSAPAGKVTLPADCLENEALNSDGKDVFCVAKATGGSNPLNAKIDEYKSKVDDLTTKANNLKSGGGARPIYVGVTTVTSKGRFERMGSETGLAAGHALCNDKYPGAHVCNVFEIYETSIAGKLNMAASIPKSWVWAPNRNGAGTDPTQGLSDDCGSFTYPTGDLSWQGVAVEWTSLRTGAYGIKLYGGAQAACSALLPLSCCR